MALDANMVYQSNMINNSATITGVAGAEIADVRCKGVKYDGNGKIVLASTAGETIIGVGILTNDAKTLAGQDVDIQVKDIGIVLLGGEVLAGAELAVTADGTFKTATTGQFVVATALEPGVADQVIRAQLTKYVKA